MKRLYRSEKDRMVLGVCGGIADYFNVDATVVRVIFAFLVVITWFVPGVIAYFILALIIPPESQVKKGVKSGQKKR